MATDRIFYLFEMQHKFVASIFSDDQIRLELADAGITRDMKGNLVASFVSTNAAPNQAAFCSFIMA